MTRSPGARPPYWETPSQHRASGQAGIKATLFPWKGGEGLEKGGSVGRTRPHSAWGLVVPSRLARLCSIHSLPGPGSHHCWPGMTGLPATASGATLDLACLSSAILYLPQQFFLQGLTGQCPLSSAVMGIQCPSLGSV